SVGFFAVGTAGRLGAVEAGDRSPPRLRRGWRMGRVGTSRKSPWTSPSAVCPRRGHLGATDMRDDDYDHFEDRFSAMKDTRKSGKANKTKARGCRRERPPAPPRDAVELTGTIMWIGPSACKVLDGDVITECLLPPDRRFGTI